MKEKKSVRLIIRIEDYIFAAMFLGLLVVALWFHAYTSACITMAIICLKAAQMFLLLRKLRKLILDNVSRDQSFLTGDHDRLEELGFNIGDFYSSSDGVRVYKKFTVFWGKQGVRAQMLFPKN